MRDNRTKERTMMVLSPAMAICASENGLEGVLLLRFVLAKRESGVQSGVRMRMRGLYMKARQY